MKNSESLIANCQILDVTGGTISVFISIMFNHVPMCTTLPWLSLKIPVTRGGITVAKFQPHRASKGVR